jgi:allantoinase
LPGCCEQDCPDLFYFYYMIHAIHSTRVITPQGMIDATVLINDGKIIDIIHGVADGIPVTDVGDHVLMPGIVDPHVHINEPGRTEWEGFDTATKAAIAGGITSLVEMPLNASPVTTTVKAFEEKLRAATLGPGLAEEAKGDSSIDVMLRQAQHDKTQLHSNCGFWGGIIPGNEKEIEPLIEKGVLGFKAFLTHSGIDEFPNVTEADLRKAMPLIAKHKLPLLVHCELSTTNHQQSTDNRSYRNYLSSRPKSWEDDAIALMIRLCEEFNCRTHIVHLSSADSIEQIAIAKQKGLPLTVETAQHYLYFHAEDIPDGRTEFKCAPPIREKENNERLWQALKDGIIDFVATDHSPAPPGLKEIVSGDLMKAWGGISSIQFALPVLWTAARRHDCQLTGIAKWLCENPALLPRLSSKGKIEKGFDADLVVWSPEEQFTVTKDIIQHKHKITPYLNETLYGVVKQSWLAGEQVLGEGKFLHLNRGKILTGKSH